MKELNGIKFAENDKEFTGSLFDPDGTCYGFCKVKKRSILFMDQQRKIFAFAGHILGYASKREELGGKIWYSYGTPAIFGGESLSVSESQKCLDKIAIGKDKSGRIYK